VVKRTFTRGTADYADEKDAADEEKQHQRRTEGSQSVYICAVCGLNPYRTEGTQSVDSVYKT
jgi:hypothetical protein